VAASIFEQVKLLDEIQEVRKNWQDISTALRTDFVDNFWMFLPQKIFHGSVSLAKQRFSQSDLQRYLGVCRFKYRIYRRRDFFHLRCDASGEHLREPTHLTNPPYWRLRNR
jgi:hypothetical protein